MTKDAVQREEMGNHLQNWAEDREFTGPKNGSKDGFASKAGKPTPGPNGSV